jgi:hypothetical protein
MCILINIIERVLAHFGLFVILLPPFERGEEMIRKQDGRRKVGLPGISCLPFKTYCQLIISKPKITCVPLLDHFFPSSLYPLGLLADASNKKVHSSGCHSD